MKRNISAKDLLPLPVAHGKRIVIIGGGVSGALTALELTLSGHSVILIEAGQIGNGSSSRSAACIRQQFQTLSTVKGMIYATECYKNWSEITHTKVTPIIQNGYLFLKNWTVDIKELERVVQMQRSAGLDDVEILSTDEISNRFPYINPVGIKCGTWCGSDGFLYPDTIYKTAIEAAREAGATIILNDEVVSVQFYGRTAKDVTTKSGKTIAGDVFINATGAWAPRISSIFGGSHLDIKARKRYLYFVDTTSSKVEDRIALTTEHIKKLPMIITPDGGYVRPESAGSTNLMIGWLQYTDPIEPKFDEQDSIERGFGFGNTDEYAYAVHKEIYTHIPDVQDMSVYSATAGLYEDTPDHNPFIGYDQNVPNLIHCAGFSGHGLMHGPFSARIVTCLINEGHDIDTITLPEIGDVDIKTFRTHRVFEHGEGMVI